jgi:hypothetical protein
MPVSAKAAADGGDGVDDVKDKNVQQNIVQLGTARKVIPRTNRAKRNPKRGGSAPTDTTKTMV